MKARIVVVMITLVASQTTTQVLAQTCSEDNTTTISTATSSQFTFTTNNQCLEIGSSGSIGQSGSPLSPAYNGVDTSSLGGIRITNAGGIYVDASGIFNNSGSIANIINSGLIYGGNATHGIDNKAYGTIANLRNTGTISTGNNSIGILNYDNSTITILNNAGSISGVDGGGITNWDSSTINTLTNTGIISYGVNSTGISNLSNSIIITLDNLGTISVGDGGVGIGNYTTSTITTLTNSGTISTGAGGVGINNSATITSLDNSGSASAGDNGSAIRNTGTISTLNNSGTISVTDNGTGAAYSVNYGILNTGSITTLSNQGNITVTASGLGSSAVGIRAAFGGTVTSFLNSGAIRATTTNTDGVAYGIRIWDGGTFSTITNTGSITAVSSGVNGLAYGIASVNVLTTLNNAQGGNASSPATTALTYRGVLPTNYNIIINSASYYGQLAVSSPIGTITNFGIYGAPFLTARTYASVLSGVALPSVTSSGTYDNMTWSLVDSGTGDIDLTFAGVSLMGTQQSLVNTANALAPIFTLQNSVLANSFSYDCNVFGANDVCVSAGGRNTAVSAANGLNNTSALLIAAYRPHPNYRIGAYADQNLSVNNAGSTVNLGNSTPLIGLFGVWNEKLDGTGTEVKVSAAYGQKNATVTRQVVGLSEAGSGSSQLNSQGAQVTAKYGFAVAKNAIVSPYVGVRYTQNNMNGYTEGASSTVTAPLTYAALNTNATTALAGVGAQYKFIPQATAFASVGVETDTNTNNGTYSATGVTGLTPISFNANPVKTRPTATVGAYYDVEKNQRLGITGIYRQEPYQAVQTTTVMATYTVGL